MVAWEEYHKIENIKTAINVELDKISETEINLSETSVGIAMKKAGVEPERRYFSWLYDGKGGQLECCACGFSADAESLSEVSK